MRIPSLLLLLCTVFHATSCARDAGDGAAAGTGSTDTSANGRQNAARAATIVDTISIEGMPEPMTLQLVESPASFPTAFTTYMPPDMRAEFISDSAAVKFVAAFGGTAEPKAFVHVQQLVRGAAVVPADSVVARILAGRTVAGVDLLAGSPPWASDGAGLMYVEEGRHYNATVAIRTDAATPFRIVIHMPSEYGDGMGPRVQALLQHWRWADGSPLIP